MPASARRVSPSASSAVKTVAVSSEQGSTASTTSSVRSRAEVEGHYLPPIDHSANRLPALSNARTALPHSMSSPRNPSASGSGSNIPHQSQQQPSQTFGSRSMTTTPYGTHSPVQYAPPNGGVVQHQLSYPPTRYPQQAYGATASPTAASPSGPPYGYSHAHGHAAHPGYAQHPGPVAHPQQAAYAAYPGYPVAYGHPQHPQMARVSDSPTIMQPPGPGMTLFAGQPPSTDPAAMAHMAENTGQKRKRRSVGDRSGAAAVESPEDDGSGSEGAAANSGPSHVDRSSKRTKTQRACDPCRRKKIRCDVLPDADPPVCQHCKQYGFDCTFFLPITETRFKKKKEMEEMAKQKESQTRSEGDEPRSQGGDKGSAENMASQSPTSRELPRGDVKIYGPTSLQYLVHSTNNLPLNVFENYDSRWNMSWAVGARGDGFIHVHEPEPTSPEDPEQGPKSVQKQFESQMIEKMINLYFTEVAPYFPVLTREEFMAHSNEHPDDRFLLYAVCTAGACLRSVPQETFEALRSALNNTMRARDILSCSTITNVQGLLIVNICFDIHTTAMSTASSANYMRTGTAIRMAQDLGLHRAEAVKTDLTRRRRVWACCLVADRWTAVALGHPFIIDRLDCDVCLPVEEPLVPGSDELRPMAYLGQLVHISILLGEVAKEIYGPTGISRTTDEALVGLLQRLDDFKTNIPEDLRFEAGSSSVYAGVLHSTHACLMMMFWRVFARITYSCPVHIKFSLSVERWTALVKQSEEAVQWFCDNQKTWDAWWVVSYCMASCGLCLYHTWSRRKDPQAAEYVKMLRDAVGSWENAFGPDHMQSRRKTAEIISLLYESTKNPPRRREKALLNPTAGVNTRVDTVPMVFRPDETRPGGGVWVLDKAKDMQEYKDLPPGTFMIERKAPRSAASRDANAHQTAADPSVGIVAVNPGPAVIQDEGRPASENQAIYLNSPHLNLDPSGGPGVGEFGVGNLNPTLAIPISNTHQVVLNPLDQNPLSAMDDSATEWAFAEGLGGLALGDWNDWSLYFNRYGFPDGMGASQNGNMPFPFLPDPSGMQGQHASGGATEGGQQMHPGTG